MKIKLPEAAQLLLRARAEFVPGANTWGVKLVEDFRTFMGTLNTGAPFILEAANTALLGAMRRWGHDRQRLGQDFVVARLRDAARDAARDLGSEEGRDATA
jgi:hypothetical protein